MRLTKKERKIVGEMFDGLCAYCGKPLGKRWHADHVNPVFRDARWVRGKGYVPTGDLLRPENDTIENIMPACAPCNIDKHAMPLDVWRTKLSRTTDVLQRNSPTYRHALRFGLVEETGLEIAFYFEQPNQLVSGG